MIASSGYTFKPILFFQKYQEVISQISLLNCIVVVLDHRFARNRPKSYDFSPIRDVNLREFRRFFGLTRIVPIRDFFFQKYVSLEQNLTRI
jgi:hypothetical protein